MRSSAALPVLAIPEEPVEAGQATEQAQGGEGSQGEQVAAQGAPGHRGLTDRTAQLGEFDPVAVTGAGIHLDFGITAGAGGKGEGQTAIGVGAAQLNRGSPLGRNQEHAGIAGGQARGEVAGQLQLAARGWKAGLQVAVGMPHHREVGLDGMGPHQAWSENQGCSSEQNRKEGAAHGGRVEGEA